MHFDNRRDSPAQESGYRYSRLFAIETMPSFGLFGLGSHCPL